MTDYISPDIPYHFEIHDVTIQDALTLVTDAADSATVALLDADEATVVSAVAGTYEAAPDIGGTGTDTVLATKASAGDEELTITVGATNALTLAVGGRIRISGHPRNEVYRVAGVARSAITAGTNTTVRIQNADETKQSAGLLRRASAGDVIYGVSAWEFTLPAYASVTDGAVYWLEVSITVASPVITAATYRRRVIGTTEATV